MNITLNNKQETIKSQNLIQLIEEFAIDTKGIAIAINNKVISRGMWEETLLNENDQIIIVSAVFGG
ncbi:MAG: sulfur carrier protein ThiS [Rikenellaceae bacterium]